ncbi:MAG: hypothetical protein RLZZ58_193 [Pseudomonadota bacterium]
MKRLMSSRWILGVGALWATAGFAAPAAAPTLAMLDGLEKGQWSLVDRDSREPFKALCVGDARAMIQLIHPRATCSRYVIDDGATEVTVHYTCPGAGHGRTTIRKETNRLVQIDTQGIAGGMPFSRTFEARRGAACSAP